MVAVAAVLGGSAFGSVLTHQDAASFDFSKEIGAAMKKRGSALVLTVKLPAFDSG
jgi:hypothetical protein